MAASDQQRTPTLRHHRTGSRDTLSSSTDFLSSLRSDHHHHVSADTQTQTDRREDDDTEDEQQPHERAALLPKRAISIATQRHLSPLQQHRLISISTGTPTNDTTSSNAVLHTQSSPVTPSDITVMSPSINGTEVVPSTEIKSAPAYGVVTRARGSSFSTTVSIANPTATITTPTSTHVSSISNTSSSSDRILYWLQTLYLHFSTWMWRQLHSHPLRLFTLPVLLITPAFLFYIDYAGKCSMSSALAPLLLYTTQVFNTHNIQYWLDYGTLLGALRDHAIIPHEFDLDLSTTQDECASILALRPLFGSDRGYKMYGRDDWVPEKASFIFGYGGYLHKPCIRLYDMSTGYYLDVDWHTQLDAKYLPSAPLSIDTTHPADRPSSSLYGSVYLPAGYTPDQGDVWCNEEGFNGGDPGGCRRDSDLFPLTTVTLYDQLMKVPHHSTVLLRDMYGADWQTPRPKGYKLLFCSILPTREWLYALIAVMYIVVPLWLYITSHIDNRVSAWRSSNKW